MIQAVVFDWGDTVMRDIPGYSGPMAHWPVVEVVPGVEDALRALHGQHRLALATNAGASDSELVRAALRRVGLDAYFESVLTARDLGAAKPDPAFFHALLAHLDAPACETLMVGDGYDTDVGGAKQAGMKAIWFNQTRAPCPCTHPVYDTEVRAMADLPAAVEQLNLPGVAECLALLAQYEVPDHVVKHSQAVAAAAFRLAAWLRERGECVDPLLAHRGGLLHDIAKVVSRQLDAAHNEMGARILSEKGQEALAEITRRHIIYAILDPSTAPETWEQKLVYYADKVVVGDELAGVEVRLEGLCLRYPAAAERIRRCMSRILDLEVEICACLGMTVEDVYDALRA